MIIDCHAHITPSPELKAYREWLMLTGGREGKGEAILWKNAVEVFGITDYLTKPEVK